ncbi:E3 ubiquitin-protein ligase TRIM7-like isoform X2 [Eublepharis macularius]|uniref:RING-type E3 ubiquitin transferase n=1 Tax=Eublepharis macularius TaxID=481883 RepID=A0AA97KWZ8_EUBMA|nr:E3 ubiquitin-protein ligase TRIM7-like isoform X2 [Eublepharis macularius]
MASQSSRERLQGEMTCAVCLDFFTEPVIVDCGHNFCRSCITPSRAKAPAACPQCREPIQERNWKPNRLLANVVQIAKELEREAERCCEKHQEPLKLFCKDDKALICVVCDRSREHRDHVVAPVEEAAEEYKVYMCSYLENLRKEREKILAYKTDSEKESQDLLKRTEAEKQKIVAKFRGLRQFLEEQENFLLAEVNEMKEEIVKNKEEHLARISKELSSLDDIIQELEEKCQQIASELLQDVSSTLQRCEQKQMFEDLVVFPLLKWKVKAFCDIDLILENVVEKLKDTLPYENWLHKDVTLDPDSAHPLLLISNDRKCVTLGDKRQHLPTTNRRFDDWLCVRGESSLISWMCYWDVEVGNEEGWAVGICRADTVIKKNESLGPETGVWAIGKWSGTYRLVNYPHNPPLSLSGEPRRIRVFLNCMGKQVSFFDADTAALLYTFRLQTLHLVFQPFFWLLKKSYLRICP